MHIFEHMFGICFNCLIYIWCYLLQSPSSLLPPPSFILPPSSSLHTCTSYIYALPVRPPGASCRSQGYPIQWVCSTCHTYIYSNTCLQHISNIGLHVRPQMHVNPKLGLHVRPQIHVNKKKVSKRSRKGLKKVSKRSSLFVDMCRYWKRGLQKVCNIDGVNVVYKIVCTKRCQLAVVQNYGSQHVCHVTSLSNACQQQRSQKGIKKVSKRSSLFVDMCRYWKRGLKKVSKRSQKGINKVCEHVSTIKMM